MQTLDQLIEKITSNPLFIRLKNIEENATGWHDHEKVFEHLTKTAKISKDQIDGNFIADPIAKTLFKKWVEDDAFGLKRKDILVLTALLHDCGKILHYKEGEKVETLITKRPTFEGQSLCPGHEFWGGEIVAKQILNDLGFAINLIEYISSVIKQHGIEYFAGKEKWSIEEIVNFVKSQAGGYYKEGLFNMYCDGYTAPAYVDGKKRIEEIFNTPSFYTSRIYFIPEL